jgi:dynein heavy chain
LIDVNDRDKFSEIAHNILEKYMTMDWELAEYKNVLFGDYELPERRYVKLSPTMDLIPCLDQQLNLYNADNRPMNLVFFEDCIMHLSKIARILR